MNAIKFGSSLISHGISNIRETITANHPSISNNSLSLAEFKSLLVDNNLRLENDPKHAFIMSVLEKHSLTGLTEKPLELEQTQSIDNQTISTEETPDIDNSPIQGTPYE